MIVVLAPVHKHLTDTQCLLHVGDNQLRILMLQQPCQLMRERLGVVVGDGGVERNVNLHSLRAGGLRETLEAKLVEDVAYPYADLTALHNVGGRSGVKVEDEERWTQDVLGKGEAGMEFKIGKVGRPHQCGQV